MLEGPKGLRPDEIPDAVRLSNSVFYPDDRIDMGAAFPTLFCPGNSANLRVMRDKGRFVSLVGFTVRDICIQGTIIRAALIGSVCTDNAYRGQGIAGLLMEDAIACARSQDAVLMLVSGDGPLYRRLGCVNAGLFMRMMVDRHAGRLPAISCAVTEWTPGDLAALQALHHAESVRFLRDAGEMRILLETGMPHCRPARTWTVKAGGATAALLCVEGPDDYTGPRVARAVEITGSRRAMIAAAPVILDASAADALEIDACAADAELESLAREYNLPVTREGMRGTLKIIDPRGFFESLRPWRAERLAADENAGLRIECGDAVTFTLGSGRLTLSPEGDLAALVFGSCERKPPHPEGAEGLQAVLDRLFPLPLPEYGLNYI
jgi:GNAT superfamily N-acetyltransferase